MPMQVDMRLHPPSRRKKTENHHSKEYLYYEYR
jgi:hypothetical protein